MNWRIGVAVIMAFVVGGAVGAFVEHERVQKSSHKASTSTASSASTTDVTAWFGGDQTAACPALQSWYQSFLNARLAVAKGGEWASMQLALLDSDNTSSAAYRALLPLANQTGSTELNFLIATETTLHKTLTVAPSANVYQAFSVTFAKTLPAGRLERDTTGLLTAALACPKA
jgi:hypothetical protein